MRSEISLNGDWKFATDPNETGELAPEEAVPVRRYETSYMNPEIDDSNWKSVAVPAHWQTQGFMYNGTAWYRHSFECHESLEKSAAVLHFKGVDYFCDAWINGYYLGSHAGYFSPFSFDVTKRLRQGRNSIVAKVVSPNDTNLIILKKREKGLIKGALQDWDANNLDINPGGIWADVRLDILPLQYVNRVHVSSFLKDSYRKADLAVSIEVVNTEKQLRNCECVIEVRPKKAGGEVSVFNNLVHLAPGINRFTTVCSLCNPLLWWSWDTGKQDMYIVKVALRGENGSFDEKSVTTGVREIRRTNGWETYLNGRRIFLKGSSYLSDQLLSTMNPDRYKKDIGLARDANMNTLRLFCVVEKEEFYDLCDEEGILLYQDFPIQWSMSDSSETVRHALPQVREMIELLGNHPSIAIWCFGSEPGKKNYAKLCTALVTEAEQLDATRIVQHSNSWKDGWDFDEYIRKYNWIVDNHFYPGWYPGVWNDVFDLLEMKPEHLGMVTEFGSQGLPCLESMAKILDRKDIWPPNWNEYSRRCFFKAQTLHWLEVPTSIEDFIKKTQDRQSFVLKYIIEFLRCRKYAPCNGAILFFLSDCWPSLTWSIVDYYRKPKKAYYVVKEAFAKVLVAMDWPRVDKLAEGIRSKIYIVNDSDADLVEMTLAFQVVNAIGAIKQQGNLRVSIEGNSLFATDEISFTALNDPRDAVELELRDSKGSLFINRYQPVNPITKKPDMESK
jgi:beta-mannosidase